MATTSEVKAGLDDIATSIRNCRKKFAQAKTSISQAYAELNAIPTTFSDEIAEIDGYTGADDFETLCQAEKAKLTTEFVALRNLINALIGTDEFSAME